MFLLVLTDKLVDFCCWLKAIHHRHVYVHKNQFVGAASETFLNLLVCVQTINCLITFDPVSAQNQDKTENVELVVINDQHWHTVALLNLLLFLGDWNFIWGVRLNQVLLTQFSYNYLLSSILPLPKNFFFFLQRNKFNISLTHWCFFEWILRAFIDYFSLRLLSLLDRYNHVELTVLPLFRTDVNYSPHLRD